nr:retrovirus-related Pol polyprotein from transposon TNT 1-94 [Tanacetum cinerariifolium]
MKQFSTARTPYQIGVVERRNRTLVEAAQTMLIFSRLPKFLWAEAVYTACFTQNRLIIHTRYNKTLYELLRGRKSNFEYLYVFGSLCYPTNDRDDLGKMKPKVDIGVFIEPELQRFNNINSSVEPMHTPSKEDLDNLFCLMFEEYFGKKSSHTPINFAAQPTQLHEDLPSTSSINIEEHEALPIETTSDKQTSPISLTESGCKDDCKSISGGLKFLGGKLMSWSLKKQDCTLMSIVEAGYVSLSTCCAQVIWMRTQLLDYEYKYNRIPMYCDSKSAIAISCNPVQHSMTKHIDIRYHFIKEHVEKGIVELYFVGTEYQLANLFTKVLPKECFEYLVHRIELLWEGIYYSLLLSTSLIPYPRFTKIIIGRYKDKAGMKIPDWMITKAMKQTEHYKMYAEVFGIYVPLIQSQPTESTQGMHRTPSTPRSTRLTPPAPVLTVDKADELILQDTLQIILVEHKSRQEQEARENVALVDDHLASVEIEKMVEGQENVADDSLIPRNDEHNIPGTRLEPMSDKESSKVEFTDVVIPMNVYDEEEEEDEITDEAKFMPYNSFGTLVNHLHDAMTESLPIMVDRHVKEQVEQQVSETLAVRPRDQDDPHDDTYLERENSAKRQKTSDRKEILVSPHPRKTTPLVLSCQRDPEAPALSLINQDLLYLKKGNLWPEKRKNPHAKIFYIRKQKEPGKPKEVIYSNSKIIQVIKTYRELGHEHKFITEIIARRANECIVLITEPDFKNLNKNDIEDITLAVRPRDQDDPHDDTYLERENSAKRQKTSEYEACVSRESSSGQDNEQEQGPLMLVVFNDDDIKEQTSRWVNKCVKKFNPYARYGVKHWKNPHAKIFYIRKQKEPGKPKEVIYSNSKIIQVIKTYRELGHEHKFITEITARRANECIVSITEPDFKNLNKNDIEDMYLLIMNGKVPDYAEIGLLWSLSVFIRSSVVEERVHDFQLELKAINRRQMRRWESYVNGRPLGLRRERPE